MKQGEIGSYIDMIQTEGISLQRGMNFRSKGRRSIILMSLRDNSPYEDEIDESGQILIYEGHDVQKNHTNGKDPKTLDQPERNPSGKLTQNGLFYHAAIEGKEKGVFEKVRVYEKLREGVWTYNGVFDLIHSWVQESKGRKVFKFKLILTTEKESESIDESIKLEHARFIPSHVKREVWVRDQGKCVQCGSTENLHFDHIIPYSKGGSSLVADNIQLLCAKHNLLKKDKIQ